MKLDPWDDAKTLALRLAQPGSKLVVVIGALAWCQKCRDYLAAFEAGAADAPANESHVWLDLEEHNAFIGSFVPDDLPLQLVYEEGRLVSCTAMRMDDGHLPLRLAELQDPGIHARLCETDWAG